MTDHFTSILVDQPIEVEFERIKNNNDLSSNNIPYTIEYVDMLIKLYETKEEYEKCDILLNFRNERISHDKKYH